MRRSGNDTTKRKNLVRKEEGHREGVEEWEE